jgi:hypothetical protein
MKTVSIEDFFRAMEFLSNTVPDIVAVKVNKELYDNLVAYMNGYPFISPATVGYKCRYTLYGIEIIEELEKLK